MVDGRVMATRTMASAIAASVRRHPNREALVFDAGTLSYAAVDHYANRVANALLGLAGRPAPTVAVMGRNSLEHALVVIAAAKAGAAVASLNWRLASDELADAVDVTDPDVVFVSEEFADATDRWGGFERDDRLVSLVAPTATSARGRRFWDLVGAASPATPDADSRPEDVLSIVFTSGSTGSSKAAAVSHRALVARGTAMAADLGLGAGETFVCWSPLSHMVSSDYLLIQLMLGGPAAVVDGYDVARIGELLRERPVGWLPVMPGTYGPLLAEIAERGAPRALRAIGSMADLMHPEQIAEITRATGAEFFNSFGSTEAGTLPVPATLIPVGVVPTTLRKTQSAFCDVRIVDEAGDECPTETPGEMLLRGPTLFSGYWRSPEATAADLTDDGWFRTGDMMMRHDDGTLDFVDRRKYMIKSGGESIYPAELERVLVSHPAVAVVAVVRASDERWGETPVAFVARRPGAEVTAGELIDHVGATLARFKRPREVVFIDADEFPRNLTGKIVRRDLEAMVRTRAGATRV